MKEETLDQHLARIVGNTRRKRRIVSITQLAQSIEEAATLLGGISELSDRVGLSSKMLRQFSLVWNLHPKVREMFESRVLDSVDLAAQLSTLELADQIIIAEKVASGAMQTKDVRDFRELRKKNGAIDPEQLIKKVITSKPQVEFLAEFVLRSGETVQILNDRFNKYLPEKEILRIKVDGSIASLALSRTGRDRIRDLARRSGFTLEQAIQLVASGRL